MGDMCRHFMNTIYGSTDMLQRLMPVGYKTCLNCLGTGRTANLDDIKNPLTDIICFEPRDVCGGSGFINGELYDALEVSVEEDD